jgi:hypothetical protein
LLVPEADSHAQVAPSASGHKLTGTGSTQTGQVQITINSSDDHPPAIPGTCRHLARTASGLCYVCTDTAGTWRFHRSVSLRILHSTGDRECISHLMRHYGDISLASSFKCRAMGPLVHLARFIRVWSTAYVNAAFEPSWQLLRCRRGLGHHGEPVASTSCTIALWRLIEMRR